jgi:hypothetical protein
MRRLLAIVIAALAFGALSGVTAYQKVRPQARESAQARWQEIDWPFPRDGWPAGRAFRCDGCGGAELYVRPKIGFCNCDTGVADDDEVDRVADLDLISERFVPLEPGQPVRIGELAGRSRSYELSMSNGAQHRAVGMAVSSGARQVAVGMAVSHGCDLFVAVVQGSATASELRLEALRFLQSAEMRRWTMTALAVRF